VEKDLWIRQLNSDNAMNHGATIIVTTVTVNLTQLVSPGSFSSTCSERESLGVVNGRDVPDCKFYCLAEPDSTNVACQTQ